MNKRIREKTAAPCADKRKKQRSRLRLWWGFLLLVAHTMAWAQDYPEYPANVSSLPIWNKQSSGEFRIEGVIDIGSPIYVNGELKLYPVATSNNPTPTIRRIFNGSNLQYAVFVLDGTDKLSIVGNENNQLTFFGGTGNIDNPIPTNQNNMGGAVQCDGNAEVRLKYVNLARFAVKTEDGLGDAVIALNGASSNGKCYLDHTTFSNCYAGKWDLTATDNKSWGRIFSLRAGTWEVIMDDVDIHDCIVHERRNSNHSGIYGMGGIIRSQGNVGGSLLMRNCTIKDNQYRDLYKDGDTVVSYYSTRYSEVAQQPLSGQGGAINWRSGAFASNQKTQVTISGCDFHDNFAMLGGAIATCATIEMNNTNIYGNKAEEGGGVYFWTYNANQDAYDGRGFTAEFNHNTLIYENTATVCGGGIAIRIDASDDVGFRADGTSRDVEFKVNLMAAEGHSQISDNHAPKGAGVAIIDRAPKNHKNTRAELMDGITNNPAYNRWSGEYTRTISIEGSEIFDNTTSSDLFSLGQNDDVAGGGIYIDKTSEDAPFPADYTVSNDGADNSGGGGGSLTVNVKHGKIYGNNAINDTREGLGGGLYIANPMKNDFPSSELTVNIGNDTPQLHINKNQAYTHGGGFYILGGNVNITRGSNQTLQIGLNPNDNDNVYRGGNKALNGNGGGFCVLGGVVTVNGGNVAFNEASLKGGGFYVEVPDASITTTVKGTANVRFNKANDGGGFYVDEGILKILENTTINNNDALNGNGGGVNTGEGSVYIENSTIRDNTAKGSVGKGSGGGVYLNGGLIEITTSSITNNTAETNGGGVNDHSGDINIYGGDISHNTATNGNGGGIYTNAGDIIIWPSVMKTNPSATVEQSEATGTTIFSNSAGTNGGGLNTHIGRLDVRFARVRHNMAGASYGEDGTGTGIGGCGGGIYCEGPHANLSGYTVRLIHTNLKYNKAYGRFQGQDMYGCGGGIYLKYGSIFAEHCDIWGNFAHGNGGGLDNHDGELRVYGCIVGKDGTTFENGIEYDNCNKASQGNGGGLNTQQGNIVVGPCDTYGYINSKSSQICHNEAGTNGGGINNHEGDITIHGDRINHNTAHTGKGGGVYVERGNIDMFGGQINHNSANDPSGGYGGGVYAGGGTFKIMEREANPILEIMEIMDVTTTGFTVHFHHVDRGHAMEYGADNKAFGIAYSTTPYPANHTSEDWENSHKINFSVDGSGNITPSEPISYIRDKGCSKVVVSHNTEETPVASNTTYYVIAYGKYTYNEKEYFDASPAVAVTTYGTLPVVVTGVAFDVTATSASVNAKQFYAGNPALTARGIEISSDGGGTWTAHPSSSVGNVFSVVVTGLAPNATYKARAYARNSQGTGYGDVIQFTTASSGGGKAAEGNYPKSIYPSVEENPFFMELTPLQQAILASTPEADTTEQHHSPEAKDDPTPEADGPVDIPQINNNTATYGGGVCIDKQGAELIFAGTRNSSATEMGQINNNYASEAGGGIYIGKESAEKYAKMQMMGKCEVNFNHVPANKQGGGIYLDGRLYVGDKDTDAIGTHGLKVDQNYAVDGSGAGLPSNYATNGKLNNVFLTRYDYDYNINATSAGDNNVSVITLLSDISGFAGPGNTNPYSHIGFSVLKGFCPVIATATEFGGDYNTVQTIIDTDEPEHSVINPFENWLYKLMIMAGADADGMAETMRGAVFEDSESYVAVHTRQNLAPFLGKFIYLWGCWTHPVVRFDPETKNPMGKVYGYGTDEAEENFLGHYKIKNPDKYTTNGSGVANGTDALEWEIYSPEGLAWFTSYVNGLNVFDEKEGGIIGYDDDDNPVYDTCHYRWNAGQNPKAKAVIMNDLDMSAYLWVPIGSVQKFYKVATDGGSLFKDSEDEPDEGYTKDKHYFQGEFDGKGHIIRGIQGLYLTGIEKFGLFGYLANGAEVKNTFVDEILFVSDNSELVYSSGGIAGEMKPGVVISNSEARGDFNTTYSANGTRIGGLVGEMKGGIIHSSMAMPTITGSKQYMGGLVGLMSSTASLKNSFANPIFLTGSSTDNYPGGLVGENNGTVENCYVRYQGTTRPSGFGWAAGSNHGTITVCFAPEGKVGEDDGQSWYTSGGNPVTLRRTYGETSLVSGKYGFAHQDQQVNVYGGDNADYIKNGPMDTDGLNGLLASLNNWVTAKNGLTNTDDPDFGKNYSKWTRTMGSPINDDYPIIRIADFNSVGSKDGIYMMYEDNVNDMWAESGKDFKACNTAGSKAAMYLYDVQPGTIPANVTITGNDKVRLYIHEDVGITQPADAVLTARVGVTIPDGDWHLFSSALANAPIGLNHSSGIINGGEPVKEENYCNRSYFDPTAKTTWTTESTVYFPTNTPYGTWKGTNDANNNGDYGYFDLYDYSENYYHWINYKRNDSDHWHMDAYSKTGAYKGYHEKFDNYPNDIQWQHGKGYMMALSSISMMMADGMLNNEVVKRQVTKSGLTENFPKLEYMATKDHSGSYTEPWRGLHLLGNPFQSYLNFDEIKTKSRGSDLRVYAVVDEDNLENLNGFIYYTKSQSRNEPYSATGLIHPHQGFFVKVDGLTSITIPNEARVAGGLATAEANPFRAAVDYPLVNLLCYDEDGRRDLTTVEVNRPEFGGGHKMERLHADNKGLVYAHLENERFQTLFVPEGVTTVPVRFEANEDGLFTFRWNTRHGEFSYLHLIDNKVGTDIDMLADDEYKFEGKTTDYKSRFKLVFRCDDEEDLDDPDDPDDREEDDDSFAFQFGDELIVNGEGLFQLFDLNGRCLIESHAVGGQSRFSVPNVAAGVYLLRLTTDKKVKVQKMIINSI